MDVAIFGTGYVGLVTGACLADGGNDVVCMDVDEAKIASLQRGEVPIYEPGLKDVVDRNARAGRLRFTTDPAEAVAHGQFQFIAVGTPPGEDGASDLRYVFQVARTIGDLMSDEKIVVTKSTIPVGTTNRVRALIGERLAAREEDIPFDVVSNPEFLKEGAAVEDFMRPDRIVIGTESRATEELMRELYAPFNRNHNRLMTMDVCSAELTKYAANAMLATRISFMNELANIAERVGADIEQVRLGIGSDPRIGYDFIYAGCGYGGSCFPKDIRALERTAAGYGYEADLLRAVEAVNHRQKGLLFEKIMAHYDGDLVGRTFAVWGLAFKPNTNDMRDAPSRYLIEALWEAGASVRAHDPAALDEARRLWGDRPGLALHDDPEEAVSGADALIIVTEWRVFRSPDFKTLREKLKEPVIFDGRNIYDPMRVAAEGFTYYGIGTGERVVASQAVAVR
ncbi:MAG TPA: UDP-glucose/GDP-mannose dehydrogenase family protein [Thermomicrobiales bacterium]|nr:UDP-glucose/GDP-mannose dehydrogenase family protein [Thermomicrobiales bacterium]